MKSDILNKINKEFHKKNKDFIYTLSFDLTGIILCDFCQS